MFALRQVVEVLDRVLKVRVIVVDFSNTLYMSLCMFVPCVTKKFPQT